jgi:hypothetical protein
MQYFPLDDGSSTIEGPRPEGQSEGEPSAPPAASMRVGDPDPAPAMTPPSEVVPALEPTVPVEAEVPAVAPPPDVPPPPASAFEAAETEPEDVWLPPPVPTPVLELPVG